jgi:AbrB family looped-hinge helix DNA binding protein
MNIGTVQSRGQVTLPKEVREAANIEPGDRVTFRVVGPSKIEITSFKVKPLEYFWERYSIDEPYDEDAIREDAEDEAAKWVFSG